MARIVKDNKNMDFPLQIGRQYSGPIDKYEVFYDLDEATNYAKTNPVAYVGQVIAVVLGEEGSATVDIYKINGDGTLAAIGGAVAVDGKSVVAGDNGALKLAGFGDTYGEGKPFEAGLQPVVVSDGADGFKLSWIKPDTTTVEGLTSTVESLGQRTTNLETKTANVEADHTKLEGIEEGAEVNKIDTVAVKDVSGEHDLVAAAKKVTIDLTAYATKVELSTIPKFAIEVVSVLPEEEISDTTIYLVKSEQEESQNLYIEYIHVSGAWEKLGEQKLDLSGYATTVAMNAAIQSAVADLASTQDVTDAVEAAKTEIEGDVDTKLVDYYTKTDADAKIKEEIAGAKTTISAEITTAKEEVLGQVDTKLEDYSTTEEVDQKISEAVSAVDVGVTKITAGDGVNVDKNTGEVTISLPAMEDKSTNNTETKNFIKDIKTDGFGRITDIISAELPEDANTFRAVQVNGEEAFGETDKTALNFADGDHIKITKDAQTGAIKISAEIPAAVVYEGSNTIEVTGEGTKTISVKTASIEDTHIKNVNVNKLVQTPGEKLVLNGGTAADE